MTSRHEAEIAMHSMFELLAQRSVDEAADGRSNISDAAIPDETTERILKSVTHIWREM